jgi:hypothetical protein
MREHLSRTEIAKDAVQHTVEAGAETVAAVSGIVIVAVRDVANALGGFATEMFEIRDAARRASAESRIETRRPEGG